MPTYTTQANRTITTVRELGKGGEGSVYEVSGHSDIVAKIYHQSIRNVDRERKLQAMIINPPQDDTRSLSPPHVSIAWPTDLLYEQGRFAGYLMPRLSQSPDIFEIYNPQMRAKNYPALDGRHLYRVAKNLATALNALHASGYVMGDVNQKNVLVTASTLVTLVDTDSFQVRGSNGSVFRCSLGVPEYTPPELHRVRLDSVDRVPAHDHFGLAVVIFQLLMEGFHPFTGAPKDPTMSVVGEIYLHCIKSGIFPYEKNRDFAPPPDSPAFTTLCPELQKTFLRCFVDGYKNPSERPKAREWIDLLNRAENALVQCKKNTTHWYSNHVNRCHWCEREAARSKAAARQTQIPVQTTFQPTIPVRQQQAPVQTRTPTQVQRPSLSVGQALNVFIARPFLLGVLCWFSLGVTSCIKVSWVRLADFNYRNEFFTESVHNDGWLGGFWIGIAAGIAWGIVRLTKRRSLGVLVGLATVGAMMIFLFSLPHSGRWGTSANAPSASPVSNTVTSTISANRVSKGRSADEKLYEFDLPSNQWVQTDLVIKPNQEVLIHHFASSESVTVILGGTSFPPLQKPGTLIPIYTSTDCSRDAGVRAAVKYFCVQLSQSVNVKLSASSSVRVGILVKNRGRN